MTAIKGTANSIAELPSGDGFEIKVVNTESDSDDSTSFAHLPGIHGAGSWESSLVWKEASTPQPWHALIRRLVTSSGSS